MIELHQLHQQLLRREGWMTRPDGAAGRGAGSKLQEQQILTKDHPSNYGTTIAKGNTMEGREDLSRGVSLTNRGRIKALSRERCGDDMLCCALTQGQLAFSERMMTTRRVLCGSVDRALPTGQTERLLYCEATPIQCK